MESRALAQITQPVGAVDPGEVDWVAPERRWAWGWRGMVIPTVFLVYLVYVGAGLTQNPRGQAILGFVFLGLFVCSYLAIFRVLSPAFRRGGSVAFAILYGLMVASFLAELPLVHAGAFVMCLYLTAIAVGRFGGRAIPAVIAMALAALFVPVAIPAWHDSFTTTFDTVSPIAIVVVAIVTFGVVRTRQANQALAEARGEIARLAAENERARIARDVHDLLGHSLTAITVKAGLARRLAPTDPAHAAQEVAEVEELARQALSEVRAAVSGYRDVTLAGELARGKELLRATGVVADLPTATDVAGLGRQELFGWAVREGITNVARHARATRCTVTLSATEVEICDDGIGGAASGATGNGLAGLRERAAAAGGTVEAGPLQPRGWRLRVVLDGSPCGHPQPSGSPS